MRFMVMHKVDKRTEAGLLPTPEFMAAMGSLIQDWAQRGVFESGEGLKPSSTRIRLNFRNGKRTMTKGPLTGNNELIAGFALLKVKSMEEAIESATRFAEVIGDVEIDLGPVTEPWDIGMEPRPAGEVPLRVLAMHKADAVSEAGAPPSPELMEEMGRLIGEMQRSGVLLATEGLAPSARGARVRYKAGKATVIDGPFAESKELIAGFAILNLPSLPEAISAVQSFAAVTGDVEIDIRPIH